MVWSSASSTLMGPFVFASVFRFSPNTHPLCSVGASRRVVYRLLHLSGHTAPFEPSVPRGVPWHHSPVEALCTQPRGRSFPRTSHVRRSEKFAYHSSFCPAVANMGYWPSRLISRGEYASGFGRERKGKQP